MVSILEAKKSIEEILLQDVDVIGVGINASGNRINVYVRKDENEMIPIVPDQMAGYPVDTVIVPTITTLATSSYRTGKFRPVPGGVSAGHFAVTAGTNGGVVYDKVSGNKFLISNNHIFANTVSKTNWRAHKWDSVIQPGGIDFGNSSDEVANLYSWIPFDDDKFNLVDAAIALPVAQNLVSPYILADSKFNTTAINGTRAITSPIRVHKYSRTSDVDYGTVLDLNFSVSVDYDDGKTRNFTDQILSDVETQGGDSGSLLFSDDGAVVGLVFAGGVDEETGRNFSVASKINNVLALLSTGGIDIMDGFHRTSESPPVFTEKPMIAESSSSDTIPETITVPTSTVKNALIVGSIAIVAYVIYYVSTRPHTGTKNTW